MAGEKLELQRMRKIDLMSSIEEEEEEDNQQLGFQEAMSFLPSNLAAEVNSRNESHGERRHGLKLPPDAAQSRNCWKSNQKPRFPTKRASGGPGMQAIFLDFDRSKSCTGTGVFLPQRAGTNFQPSKKPACCPVLLPCRVVQALNLNVHARLHVSPNQGVNKINNGNNNKAGDRSINAVGNKTGIEAPTHHHHHHHHQSSEEIFLPKEWTY